MSFKIYAGGKLSNMIFVVYPADVEPIAAERRGPMLLHFGDMGKQRIQKKTVLQKAMFYPVIPPNLV